MEITLQLCFVLVYQFTPSFSISELHYKCFSYNDIFFITSQLRYLFVRRSYVFYDVRITLYFGTFQLRMVKTLQLRSVFVLHCDYFLLHRNYVIYLFDVVTFFYNVRITVYFGTFQLRMEITLQLRFVFVRHCDVFFITSQLRYLFVRCSYVFS